jgi:hypothetical protein
LTAAPSQAGTPFTGATEWTQIMNNAELVSLVGQSGEQIGNQITQISQLAEQIQNQIRIYQSMLQNTLTLPSHVWGQVEGDLNRLRSLVTQGQGIAFSMGNADDAAPAFPEFLRIQVGPRKWRDLLGKLPAMVDTNRDTIARRSARPASHRSNSHPKKRPWAGALHVAAQSADAGAAGRSPDRRPAGGAGPEVAGPRLAANHHDGRWYQSEQAAKDLAQNRREEFFNSNAPSTSGGQTMEPRW